MGFIFALAILWFVLGRLRWRRAGMRPMYWGNVARWQRGAWSGHHARQSLCGPPVAFVPLWMMQRAERAPVGEPTREAPLEVLKRRYVSGELSDEQYEHELDVLFAAPSRTPR